MEVLVQCSPSLELFAQREVGLRILSEPLLILFRVREVATIQSLISTEVH